LIKKNLLKAGEKNLGLEWGGGELCVPLENPGLTPLPLALKFYSNGYFVKKLEMVMI